jgi:O-acetyl-ADP-ribose deacetylase (regulator of RNase III)
MIIKILDGDITRIPVDCIVNSTDTTLLSGGKVHQAIHKAAGNKLLRECKTLGGLKISEAKITDGYKLKAKKVIHTVAPTWAGGGQEEDLNLAKCFRQCLELAEKSHLKTMAFPVIGIGSHGFPLNVACKTELEEIRKFVKFGEVIQEVFIVTHDPYAFDEFKKIF